MPPGSRPPRFFSLAFHAKFFPAVLWRGVRPAQEECAPRFANHLPMECLLLFVGCAVLIAVGLPRAMARGSLIGWALCGAGGLGLLALLVQSVRAQAGSRPSFDAFRPVIFVFCIALGTILGVFAGSTLLHGRWVSIAGGLIGLLAGYASGIVAGLWIQRLGWLGLLVDLVAGCALIGMLVVGLVLAVVHGTS